MRMARVPGTMLHPGGIDPWRSFVQLGPALIDEARRARADAQHYDGFNVGSVALGYAATTGSIGLFRAANQNRQPGSNPSKMCAERINLQKMTQHGFNHLIAMVTSGPPQADSQSGRQLTTLHTCGECRAVMQERPEVPDDALVVTVQPYQDIYEIHTFGELQKLHAGLTAADGLYYEDPGFTKWQAGLNAYDLYQGELMPEIATVPASPAHLARLAVTHELFQRNPNY